MPKHHDQRADPGFLSLLPPVLPMGSHEHPVLRNQAEGQGADSGEEHHRQPYASPVGVALLVFPGFDSGGDKVRLGWLEKNTPSALNPSASDRSL